MMRHVCIIVAFVALLGASGASAAGPRKKPKRMTFTATAYCQHGTTASGEHTRRGIAAADPRVIPLGSTIALSGHGLERTTYAVEDSGKHVKGRRIDIFMPSCRDAKRFGRKSVQLQIVRLATAEPSAAERR